MYIELSEEEAHVLILKALGLDQDAALKKRGVLHVLNSPHKIVIQLPGQGPSIFRPDPEEEFIEGCFKPKDIPDDCFVVDGIDESMDFEEGLDGT